MPEGAVGEIAIQGEGLMKGYWNNRATDEAIPDGCGSTPSLATRDAVGLLHHRRPQEGDDHPRWIQHLPREIEEALYEHPAVAEAAVIGIKHLELGEEVGAAVVLKRGATAGSEDIRAFVRSKVAAYKYPRRIRFRGLPPEGIDWQDFAASGVAARNLGRPLSRTLRSRSATSPRAGNPPAHHQPQGGHHGIHEPDFPPIEPEEFLRRPLMDRMKFLTLWWVENGFKHAENDPRHLHREAALLLHSRRGGGEHGDLAPTVLGRGELVEPADRVPEGHPLDGPARGSGRGRIVGPVGRQIHSDDRWHPVLGAAGHHPAAAVVAGAVHLR